MNPYDKGKIIPQSTRKVNRSYTQSYKVKVLEMGSRCKDINEFNALLRQEKLHSAQLSKWWKEFSHQLAFEQTVNQTSGNTPLALPSIGARHSHHSYYSPDKTTEPREIFAKLWRRKWLMLTTMFVSMLLAFTLFKSVTPSYTSKALIMIGSSDSQLSIARSNSFPQFVDIGVMQNELEILRSYHIAEQVIKQLSLEKVPEFNPALKEKGKISKLLEKLNLGSARKIEREFDSSVPYENIPVIETFLNKQKLSLVGESRLIELEFTSENPNLSAKIANTTLDIYLKDQMERSFSATNKTNIWLEQRIDALKQKVEDAEAKIEDYRQSEDLPLTTNNITLNNKKVSELKEELALASPDRAEKETRLNQIIHSSKENPSSTAEALNTPRIIKLKEQEKELQTHLAELASAYSADHPKILNIQAEKKNTQNKISEEIDKVIVRLKDEARMAIVHEQKLTNQLKSLEASIADSSTQEVQLNALEREAEVTRKLLDTFLTRYKETSNQQTSLNVQHSDAKIISYATPARKPSYPKALPILSLAFLGSLLLGLLSVFVRELFDSGYRSALQIEKDTGLPSLGLIPKLSKLRSKTSSPNEYVQKFPASPLSESIRSIYTNMVFGKNGSHTNKVIQFTSAYPGEGKSTLSQSLAILKRQAGLKTILIDADMRSPSVHTSFKVRAQPGLAEYLSGTAAVHQVITQHKTTGVYLITAGLAKQSPTDLLPSQKMDDLISDLSEVFDLIIIDSPPVLAAPDARILSTKVDLTAFIVKWADTRKSVVQYALKQLADSGSKKTSTVLNMVDAKKHSQYSFADSGVYVGKLKQYYIAG